MSGQKKKNQATTAKAPKTDAKYADAIGWESSRLSLAEKSEARAWLTAKILGATNIALVAAIVIMMPLKDAPLRHRSRQVDRHVDHPLGC